MPVTGGSVGSTLGRIGGGLFGTLFAGPVGGIIGSRLGGSIGNLAGSGLSSLFGPNGFRGLSMFTQGYGAPGGAAAVGTTPSIGGWSVDRYGNLISPSGGNVSSVSGPTIDPKRVSMYSTSNQGPQAFARNNTASVMGRNII